MTIKEWQKAVWDGMEEKGFHTGRQPDGRDDTLVRLCLIHTEVAEASQEVKRHWLHSGPESDESRERFAEEMADTVIRILDTCECTGVDLEKAVAAKMEKNMKRPFLYGTAHAGANPASRA